MAGSVGLSGISEQPDVGSLAPWAAETRRVDKPWGYELIWAVTDIYVGKVLFVKAGESLSLQYHEQKDESWLIQSGLAKIELGAVGDEKLAEEVVGPGAAFHYRARHRPPDHRGRGHHDPRGLDSASRRRRPPRRQLRPRRHLVAVARPQPLRSRHGHVTTSSLPFQKGRFSPLPGARFGGIGSARTRPNLHTTVIRFARGGTDRWTGGRPHGLVAADAALPRGASPRCPAAHAVRLPRLRARRAQPASRPP